MKKSDWDDIEVNERKTDKVFFESRLLQNISDSIDFLKDETNEMLRELDSTEFKQRIDEFDLEEFSENTINQIDDIFDEISQFKDEIMESQDIPDDVREFSKNTKAYLNRDMIYVKKARRKLESSNSYYTSNRAIELCDKAIYVNEHNVEAYYLKGMALVNLKKYDEAIEEFINVLALDSDNLDARLAIADANRLNGDFEDAIDVYDSVLAIDGLNFEAYRGKALACFDMEDYENACEFFIRANTFGSLASDDKKVWEMCESQLD